MGLILSVQFAIRPTLRNHNTLTRDSVIKQIASIVGPGHTVDLKDYELLIVVEIYQVSHHAWTHVPTAPMNRAAKLTS